jgi:hypothetical protein
MLNKYGGSMWEWIHLISLRIGASGGLDDVTFWVQSKAENSLKS